MQRPLNYGMVPTNKYKGGMGSVAQFPLDPNLSAQDIANEIPLTPFANWATSYGGLNSFVDLNPRSPIPSAGGSIMQTSATSLTGILSKYGMWIAGGILVAVLLKGRR
jgi:hypothetical protein